MKITDHTKESLYILMDLLDILSKSSKNGSFISIREHDLLEIKQTLFAVIGFGDSSQENETKTDSTITDLIGILPIVLVDKDKFPTNGDISKFAKRSLDLDIPSWEKKSREELIGRIVVQVAIKDELELESFLKVWRKFNLQEETQKKKTSGNKSKFVDTWLSFFDKYKE